MWRFLAIGASIAFGLVAQPVEATVLNLSFSGTITSGNDVDNLFGGGDLTGANYTSLFIVDTTASQRSQGFETDRFQPVQSASITISGRTFAVIMPDYSFINENASPFVSNGITGGAFNASGVELSDQLGTQPFDSGHLVVTDADLTKPFSYRKQNGDFTGGFFETTNEALALSANSVKLTVSNAPEPASWALMLAGFGTIGLTMRRRQRATVRYI